MSPGKRPDLANPRHLLAFGFGTGLAPRAPGTAGTLVGIPAYLLLAPLPLPAYLAVLVVGFAIGVWICDTTSRDLGVHDHPGIVFDEVVGYLVTMIAAPAGWPWLLVGFVAFRFFDIVKPWPVRIADRRVGGGFGIMLDDVLAGLYALATVQLLALAVG
jgi:phosphatidylglycerophosphatase A